MKFRLALSVKMLIGGHRLSSRMSSLALRPLAAVMIEGIQLVATRLAEHPIPGWIYWIDKCFGKENKPRSYIDYIYDIPVE